MTEITVEEIAKEVIGWHADKLAIYWLDKAENKVARISPVFSNSGGHIFDPLHDHNDSAMVVEELFEIGYDYGDVINENEKYIYFQDQGRGRAIYLEYYETISDRPAAICKASLEAVRKEKE